MMSLKSSSPWLSAALGLILVTGCASRSRDSTPSAAKASEPAQSSAVNASLRDELIEMMERDQDFRTRGTDPSLPADERADLMREGGDADRRHTSRLGEIIAEFGWPTRSMVGKQGALAAFLIVQHADHDPDFQARCLPMLVEAAEHGEVSKGHVAYLTDRVRVKQGKPQLYGTQYGSAHAPDGSAQTDDHGHVRYLLPLVEDVARLDQRREAAGLGPWIDYEKRMAKLQGRDPQDRPRSAESADSG